MSGYKVEFMPGHKGSGETLESTPGGGGVRPKGGMELVAKFKSEYVTEWEKESIGASWAGFIMELQKTTKLDASAYFPDLSGVEKGEHVNARLEYLKKYAQETAYGRTMAAHGGIPLAYFKVTPQEWMAFYWRMMAGLPTQSTQSSAPQAQGGLLSPLPEATGLISSAFGVAREDGPHRGVDVACPVGTPVRAAADGIVLRVWEDAEGGRNVSYAFRRQDGGYAAATSAGNDSGIVISHCHLSEVKVKAGDEVKAGHVLALSGNTGKSTGPHLHTQAELYVDADFLSLTDWNHRELLDPVALWGGETAFLGLSQVPWSAREVRAQEVERDGSSKGVTVNIGGDGAVSVNGTAVQTSIKPVLDMVPWGSASLLETARAVPDIARRWGLPTPDEVVHAAGQAVDATARWAATPQGRQVGALGIRMGTTAAQAVLGVGGTVLQVAAPFLNAVPYAGPALSAAATIVGNVAPNAAPIVGQVGNALADALEGKGWQAPPIPGLGQLVPH